MNTYGDNIDHIVVLMLENRSFDMVLGNLYDSETNPKGPTYILGADQSEFKGISHWRSQVGDQVGQPPAGTFEEQLWHPVTSPHEPITHVQRQLYNNEISEENNAQWDWEKEPTVEGMTEGFVKDYANRIAEFLNQVPEWARNPNAILGAFEEKHLPNFYRLAKAGVVSDEWFCSVPSQTWTNRLFQFAGRARGVIENEQSPTGTARHLVSVMGDTPTVQSVLGDESQVVSHGYFPSLTRVLHGGRGVNGISYDQFQKNCVQDTLPRYTFIEPLFSSGKENRADSMHPFDMTSPTSGNPVNLRVPCTNADNLIARIYGWMFPGKNYGAENRRLLIVTFDEHGGCADHIPPPTAANDGIEQAAFYYKLSSKKINFFFQRLGVRVPFMMCNPQLQAGGVIRPPKGSTGFFDHSSIIKSLALWSKLPQDQRDQLAALSSRVEEAPHFWDAFQNGPPPGESSLLGSAAKCASFLSSLNTEQERGPFPEAPLTHLGRSIVLGYLVEEGVGEAELEPLIEAMARDEISGEAARYLMFRRVGFGKPLFAERILAAEPAEKPAVGDLIPQAIAYSKQVHDAPPRAAGQA